VAGEKFHILDSFNKKNRSFLLQNNAIVIESKKIENNPMMRINLFKLELGKIIRILLNS